MKKKVENALIELGITPYLKGFYYISSAVEIILKSNGKVRIVDGVYVDIAKEFDTTASRVERAIRYAFSKVNIENKAFIEYLGTDKLTNGALLYTLAYRLKDADL